MSVPLWDDDNFKNLDFRSLLDALEAHGWHELSAGSFGFAMGSPCNRFVAKVGMYANDRAMQTVLRLSRAYADNPYLPRIHNCLRLSCGRMTYVMERLQPHNSTKDVDGLRAAMGDFNMFENMAHAQHPDEWRIRTALQQGLAAQDPASAHDLLTQARKLYHTPWPGNNPDYMSLAFGMNVCDALEAHPALAQHPDYLRLAHEVTQQYMDATPETHQRAEIVNVMLNELACRPYLRLDHRSYANYAFRQPDNTGVMMDPLVDRQFDME